MRCTDPYHLRHKPHVIQAASVTQGTRLSPLFRDQALPDARSWDEGLAGAEGERLDGRSRGAGPNAVPSAHSGLLDYIETRMESGVNIVEGIEAFGRRV